MSDIGVILSGSIRVSQRFYCSLIRVFKLNLCGQSIAVSKGRESDTILPIMPVEGSVALLAPGRPLQVLIVEDSELDARVLVGHLRQGGYQPQWLRVASAVGMQEALRSSRWDAILCDHSMPGFSAPEALRLLQETGLDIPFLIVSAGIGEDVAVAAMKAGANDFLIKGDLARLVPAVEREIREAGIRLARRTAENSLRENELRYRLVWENSADAVLLLDANGDIRFANPAVQTVFGWDPHELVGRPLDSLRDTRLPGPHWWSDRQILRGESVGCRRDGTTVAVDIALSELRLNDLQLVAAFIRDITARKAAESELQKNREEFAAAREIQQRLFPRRFPQVTGFEFAGVSQPAEAAGGDYFDFIPYDDGCLGIVVADVSGHGLGPALVMAEARTCLRILARTEPDPAKVLTAANRILAEDLDNCRYITLLLVRLDPVRRRLRFASAGHPPGWILDASGQLKKELRRTGPALGQRREFLFTNGPDIELADGDIGVFLTDGILEAANGSDAFGRERVLALIHSNRGIPAGAIVGKLADAARAYSVPEPQADDLTAVVMKVG